MAVSSTIDPSADEQGNLLANPIHSYDDWKSQFSNDDSQTFEEKLPSYIDYLRTSFFNRGELTKDVEISLQEFYADQIIGDKEVSDEEYYDTAAKSTAYNRTLDDDVDLVRALKGDGAANQFLNSSYGEKLKASNEARESLLATGDISYASLFHDNMGLVRSGNYADQAPVGDKRYRAEKAAIEAYKKGYLDPRDMWQVNEGLKDSGVGGLTNFQAREDDELLAILGKALSEEVESGETTLNDAITSLIDLDFYRESQIDPEADIASRLFQEFRAEDPTKIDQVVLDKLPESLDMIQDSLVDKFLESKRLVGAAAEEQVTGRLKEQDTYSKERIGTLIKELAIRHANLQGSFKFFEDPKDDKRNIRITEMGSVIAHPSLMGQKERFEKAVESDDRLSDKQKEVLRDQREIYMQGRVKSLDELFTDFDAVNKQWEAAKARNPSGFAKEPVAFIDDFLSKSANYKSVKNTMEGIKASVVDSLFGIIHTIGAVAFNSKTSANYIVDHQKKESRRRELATIFGKPKGLAYDVATTVAPLIADLTATGILTIATGYGGAMYASAKAGAGMTARVTGRGMMKALTGSLLYQAPGQTAKESAEALVTKKLIDKSGVDGATAAIKSFNKIIQDKFVINSNLFLTSATRSAGGMYGTIYGSLPDDMSHEEKHDKALGHSLLAGVVTGTIVSGMSAIGRGGVENILLRNMSYGSMKNILQRISRVELSDGALKEVLKKHIKDRTRDIAKKQLPTGLFRNAVNEGFEEGLDQFVNTFVEDSALDKKTPLKDKIMQSFHAAQLGAIMGAGVPALGKGKQLINKIRGASYVDPDIFRGQEVERAVSALQAAGSPLSAAELRKQLTTAARETSKPGQTPEPKQPLPTTVEPRDPPKPEQGEQKDLPADVKESLFDQMESFLEDPANVGAPIVPARFLISASKDPDLYLSKNGVILGFRNPAGEWIGKQPEDQPQPDQPQPDQPQPDQPQPEDPPSLELPRGKETFIRPTEEEGGISPRESERILGEGLAFIDSEGDPFTKVTPDELATRAGVMKMFSIFKNQNKERLNAFGITFAGGYDPKGTGEAGVGSSWAGTTFHFNAARLSRRLEKLPKEQRRNELRITFAEELVHACEQVMLRNEYSKSPRAKGYSYDVYHRGRAKQILNSMNVDQILDAAVEYDVDYDDIGRNLRKRKFKEQFKLRDLESYRYDINAFAAIVKDVTGYPPRTIVAEGIRQFIQFRKYGTTTESFSEERPVHKTFVQYVAKIFKVFREVLDGQSFDPKTNNVFEEHILNVDKKIAEFWGQDFEKSFAKDEADAQRRINQEIERQKKEEEGEMPSLNEGDRVSYDNKNWVIKDILYDQDEVALTRLTGVETGNPYEEELNIPMATAEQKVLNKETTFVSVVEPDIDTSIIETSRNPASDLNTEETEQRLVSMINSARYASGTFGVELQVDETPTAEKGAFWSEGENIYVNPYGLHKLIDGLRDEDAQAEIESEIVRQTASVASYRNISQTEIDDIVNNTSDADFLEIINTLPQEERALAGDRLNSENPQIVKEEKERLVEQRINDFSSRLLRGHTVNEDRLFFQGNPGWMATTIYFLEGVLNRVWSSRQVRQENPYLTTGIRRTIEELRAMKGGYRIPNNKMAFDRNKPGATIMALKDALEEEVVSNARATPTGKWPQDHAGLKQVIEGGSIRNMGGIPSGMEGSRVTLSHTNISLGRFSRADGGYHDTKYPMGVMPFALEIKGKKYNAFNVRLTDVNNINLKNDVYDSFLTGTSKVYETAEDMSFEQLLEAVNVGREDPTKRIGKTDLELTNPDIAGQERIPKGTIIYAQGAKKVVGGPAGTLTSYNQDIDMSDLEGWVSIAYNPAQANYMYPVTGSATAPNFETNRIFTGADELLMVSDLGKKSPEEGANFILLAKGARFETITPKEVEDRSSAAKIRKLLKDKKSTLLKAPPEADTAMEVDAVAMEVDAASVPVDAVTAMADPEEPKAPFRIKNVLDTLEVPVYEIGAYKKPPKWLSWLTGKEDERLRRLNEMRTQYGRMINKELREYKEIFDNLITDTYGSYKMAPVDLIAAATGSTKGKLIDDETRELIDSDHRETVNLINKEYADLPVERSMLLMEAESAKAARIRYEEQVKVRQIRKAREDALKLIRKDSPELADHLVTLRAKVDDLSKQIGSMTGKRSAEMTAHIDNQLGIYLTRSYKIFSDENWIDDVLNKEEYRDLRDSVKVEFIDYLKKEEAASLFEKYERQFQDDRDSDWNKLSYTGKMQQVQTEASETIAKREVAYAKEGQSYAEVIMEDFLSNYKKGFWDTQSPEIKNRTVDILRRKKNMPEFMLKLLGEYKGDTGDFNLMRTFVNVSNLASNLAMLNNMVTVGRRGDKTDWWFLTKEELDELKEEDPQKYADWAVVHKPKKQGHVVGTMRFDPTRNFINEDGESKGPLFASPEFITDFQAMMSFKESLSDTNKVAASLDAPLRRLTGMALGAKTLGSVPFYIRNIISNVLFFGPAQGVLPLGRMFGKREGFFLGGTLRAELIRKLSTPEKVDEYSSKLIKLGVLDNELTSSLLEALKKGKYGEEDIIGDMNKYLNEAAKAAGIPDMENASEGERQAFLENIKKGGSKIKSKSWDAAVDKLRALSEVVDSFYKIAYYESELATMQKAKESAKKNDPIYNMTPENLEQEAARKIKMTAQSYSQAPPIVAGMQNSVFGVLFSPYFRFKLEVPRIMFNTYKLGIEELRSGNSVIAVRGARRLFGMNAMVVGFSMLAKSLGEKAVVSIINAFGGDAEDDDLTQEQENIIRMGSPPYLRSHTFYFFKLNGVLQSLDLTYVNPFAMYADAFPRAWEHLSRGDESAAVSSFLDTLVSVPFLDGQIAFTSLMQAKNNQDAEGDPLWRETESAYSKLSKGISHVFMKAYAPPTLERLSKLAASEDASREELFETPYGILFKEFLPFRPYTIDPSQVKYRIMKDLSDDTNMLEGDLRSILTGKLMSQDDIEDIALEQIEGNRKIGEVLKRVYTPLRELGVSSDEMEEAMKRMLTNEQLSTLVNENAMLLKTITPSMQKILDESDQQDIRERYLTFERKIYDEVPDGKVYLSED